MGLKEDCIKVINETITEAKLTEIIEIDINDIAKLLNGYLMYIDLDTDVRHLIVRFKEEK